MHIIRKALVAAAVAATGAVVPAQPAIASDCAGTVQFVSGSPTLSTSSPTELRGTFQTQGPGFIAGHCDLGWVTTCEMEVDGVPVSPVSCPTHYTPEPDRCPSAPPCGVDVVSTQTLAPGLHVVKARLGMKWGCCGYVGGPETVAEGEWLVLQTGDIDPGCDSDLCRKVRPIVKILFPDPIEI